MCHRSESYVEQILEQNETLKEENKELKEENAELKQSIQELEKKLKIYDNPNTPPSQKRFSSSKSKDKPKGKPGRKKGHKGCGRKIPEQVDETIELETETCPYCNTRLTQKSVETRDRYIVDIEPAKPKRIRYRLKRKYCPECKKIVSEKPKDVIPRARLGLNLLLFIAFHKYVAMTPVNKLCTILDKYYDVHISTATVVNELDLLAQALGKDFNQIIEEMKDEHSVNADETGHKINGDNCWLWTFITRTRALFLVRNSRSSDVPKEVLGEDFEGVVTSDFWTAYNWIKNQQKCWSHILRKTRDMEEDYLLHYKLKKFYRKAKRVENADISEGEKQLEVARLEREIEKMKTIPFNTKEARATANTLAKNKNHLFRFVTDKQVEATNNAAERPLRHLVTMRKISGGSRSEKGARTLEVNTSVMQTWKLQGKDFFEEGRERLLEFSEN